MGEANEGRSRAMENFFPQREKYPRDLRQRLMPSINTHQSQFAEPNEEGDSEEIELNLGLSLGGRFGVDKNPTKKLIRSSSIAGMTPLFRDENPSTTPPVVSYPTLVRTSSLPTETEEEWRKRKELQSLRRLEAKRRRSEKQRNKEGCGSGSGFLDEGTVRCENEGLVGLNSRENKNCFGEPGGNRLGLGLVPPPLPNWAAAAVASRQGLVGGIVDLMVAKGKVGVLGSQGSAGSAESQGGSSSGMSELESKPLQGSSSCGEARSPSSNQAFQDRGNQETVGSCATRTHENLFRTKSVEIDNPSKKPDSAEHVRRKETGKSTVEDMPCVFTIGDGPNGRRAEGILYKYGKGEEVRIMCVCHGNFLSPAEFVKHAGGGEVEHPLRRIVLNPNAAPFL